MGNGEQSDSGGRADWRVRLAIVVGALVGASLGQLFRFLGVDLGGFLPGAIAYVALVGVGAVLGQLVGSLLFRRPPHK
jgi:hypothetical protein